MVTSRKATPTIDKFLTEVARILREKNGVQLQDFVILEPPLPPLYNDIVDELRQSFPATDIQHASDGQDALEAKCEALLPEFAEGDEGGSWTSFVSFIVKYFVFMRDVDVNHLVETHDMLKALLNQCILALSSWEGLVVLPTVISLSRTLARLAIGLDKRPELVAHLTRRESTAGGSEEAAERVTLVEGTANVIREAFKKCLSERGGNSSGLNVNGTPEGRRTGIYVTANLCLKLFFHCRKLRSAEQIFGNIYQQSPPLAKYPASQRVTYLYYLGRYLFANSHFFRAQLALQAAYDQCHLRCTKQRRLIMIYLIASNITLGRFPSPQFLQRPEAEGLKERFTPICESIAKGDMARFRQLLDLNNDDAEWFLRKRILLQLSNRCEIIVWRSLARKTFLLSGFQGDATSKRAPTLDLQDMLTLAMHLKKQNLGPNGLPKPRIHTNSIFIFPTASDTATNNSTTDHDGYIDPDLEGAVEPSGPDLPTMEIIESITASLVEQDLLHGFISHKSQRFAITGAKTAGALNVGFPNVWETVSQKADGAVPGWVREEKKASTGGVLAGPVGGGMVINLSGARPVGAAPA